MADEEDGTVVVDEFVMVAVLVGKCSVSEPDELPTLFPCAGSAAEDDETA